MDFTAIDFETATRHADSACQLAAVRVRENKIVHERCWLIRPRPFSFSRQNIQIHGITPNQVRDEPEFGELWSEIRDTFADDCLIAHNASFDLGVLLACLQTHGQPIPELQYTCTRAIARRAWPERPRFGLKPLSDWLGIRFKHHDALEDSVACARIAIAAAIANQADSLEQLEQALKLSRGAAGPWGKNGPKTIRRSKSNAGYTRSKPPTLDSSPQPDCLVTPVGMDWQRLLIRAEFIKPLRGQRVVFTGTLSRLPKENVDVLTERCGGQYRTSVSSKTSLLVIGSPDERTVAAGRAVSVKEEKARELISQGVNLKILTEDEFLQLLVQV